MPVTLNQFFSVVQYARQLQHFQVPFNITAIWGKRSSSLSAATSATICVTLHLSGSAPLMYVVCTRDPDRSFPRNASFVYFALIGVELATNAVLKAVVWRQERQAAKQEVYSAQGQRTASSVDQELQHVPLCDGAGHGLGHLRIAPSEHAKAEKVDASNLDDLVTIATEMLRYYSLPNTQQISPTRS